MTSYGQFCPIAKASEVLGERWVLLIVRELLLGSHRFSEFQRALSRISPTLLTRRLKQLEQAGIVVRKQPPGHKAHEYFLTPAGRELAPLVEQLGKWGMRWARGRLSDEELDVEFLMWDIQRRLETGSLPDGETVLCFIFEETVELRSWWLVVRNDEVDLCTENPGKDVDLYINTGLRQLVEVWEGDIDIKTALRQGLISTSGNSRLARDMPEWLGINPYAGIRPG